MKKYVFKILTKFFKFLIVFICLGLSLVFYLIILLPDFVSLPYVARFIEKEVKNITSITVEIKSINWGWISGINIEGINIPDETSGDSLFKLDNLHFKLGLSKILSRSIGVDLIIDGISFKFIKNANGETNLDVLLKKLQTGKTETAVAPAEPEQVPLPKIAEEKKVPFILPIDLKSKIHINNIFFMLEDKVQGFGVKVNNAFLRLDMPSLISKPISFRIFSELEMNNTPYPPLDLNLAINDLFLADKTLNIQGLQIFSSISAPGVNLSLNGKPLDTKISTQINVDIPKIFRLAAPFLKGPVGNTKVDGIISLNVDASGRYDDTINFTVNLKGNNIAAANGILEEKKIGPVNFSIDNAGSANLSQQKLLINKFNINLLEKCKIILDAKVEDFLSKAPFIDANLKLLHLDIGELFKLANDFIPKNLPVNFAQDNSIFSIEDLSFSGNVPKGANKISLKKINLSVPSVNFKQNDMSADINMLNFGIKDIKAELIDFLPKKVSLALSLNLGQFSFSQKDMNCSAKNLKIGIKDINAEIEELLPKSVSLSLNLGLEQFNFNQKDISCSAKNFKIVNNVNVQIANLFPQKASIDLNLGLGEFNFNGPINLNVTGVKIDKISVNADKIEKEEDSIAGIISQISLSENIIIDKIKIPKMLEVKDFKESINLSCELLKDKKAKASLKKFSVSIPFISYENEKLGVFKTSSDINLKLDKFQLNKLDPPQADISGVNVDIKVADVLGVKIDADAKNLGESSIKTKGEISINLENAYKDFISKILNTIKVNGDVKLKWAFDGRRPSPEEIENLSKTPSFDLKQDLAFIDNLYVSLLLNSINAGIKVDDKTTFEIKNLSTIKPFSYQFSSHNGKGEINFELGTSIKETPPTRLKKPLNINFKLSANHDNLNTFLLSESFSVEPLEFSQKINLSLYGIDKLLKKDINKDKSVLLNTVGGDFSFNLNINKASDIKMFVEGIDVKGSIKTAINLGLIPGETAFMKINSNIPEMDIAMNKTLNIDDLTLNLNLEKKYSLKKDRKEELIIADIPLSVRVIKPEPKSSMTVTSRGNFVEKYIEDISGRIKDNYTFSFKSAKVQSSPFPIEVNYAKIDFDLNNGLPVIDNFQMDILGGTIIGSISVIKKSSDNFFIQIQTAFSGIDTKNIFRDIKFSGKEDAELGGQLIIIVPIFTKLSQLLNEMQVDIKFTHIGSRAIERLLYGLDPYESNETIVMQRKFFRKGTPKWITIAIKNGNLSVKGEIEILGVGIKIPSLERLNISNLPGLSKFEKNLSALSVLIELLKALSSDGISMNQNGELSFF
ncbi:MAG: hypothetical protein HQK76_10195 [Desulfobacterales bacterium]|nr:hypothetical protein [Desulfobacterales bacterium]